MLAGLDIEMHQAAAKMIEDASSSATEMEDSDRKTRFLVLQDSADSGGLKPCFCA